MKTQLYTFITMNTAFDKEMYLHLLTESLFDVAVLENSSPIEALKGGNLLFVDAKWVDEKLLVNKYAFVI